MVGDILQHWYFLSGFCKVQCGNYQKMKVIFFSPGIFDSSERCRGERRRKTETQRDNGFKSAGKLEQG